jgi:outer membrane protein TolC
MTTNRLTRATATRSLTTAGWLLLAVLVPATARGQSRETELLERLSLENAVRLALQNNRQLQSARLEVEQAEANLAAARTRRLPVFSTEVNASQLLTPVDFAFPRGAFGDFPGTGPIPSADTTVSVPRQPTYYVSSDVSQPLSQLFRINLGIKSATAARDVERERVRGEQLTVINNVKRLYFAILQTESAIVATHEAMALYRELDRTLDSRVAQKVALRSDSLDVQFRLAREELALVTHTNALASQKEQMNQLLGRDVRTAFDVEDVAEISVLDVDLDAARTRALESRPDVRQARLRVEQAELDRRMTKADRIPEVSLAVSYTSNVNMDILPTNLATFGVRMKWEPFDWGRRNHELAVKTHSAQQARLGVREIEDRTVLEINSRYRTLSEKRALLNVARMAQATSREKLRVKVNQYQVQAVLLPDVLQVRAELAESDDQFQRALLEFWGAKADYERAVGEDVRQ